MRTLLWTVGLGLFAVTDHCLSQNAAERAEQATAGYYQSAAPIEFNPGVHALYKASGSATIEGQAFLRQQGGGVVTCAGSEVLLAPATAFYRAAIVDPKFIYGATASLMSADAKALIHETMCDATGNFTFSGVAAGVWVVITDVSWVAAGRREGGALVKEVEVPRMGTLKLIIAERR